jgi:hypothetical protein
VRLLATSDSREAGARPGRDQWHNGFESRKPSLGRQQRQQALTMDGRIGTATLRQGPHITDADGRGGGQARWKRGCGGETFGRFRPNWSGLTKS